MFIIIGSIVATLAMAYLWLMRGFFSALIHLICTIAAGAIAFALWEPASYLLLNSGPGFLHGAAFAIGLVVPFVIVLAILRVAVDGMLPKNAQADKITDAVGGAVCGLASSAIAVGIVVIGTGTMWFPTEGMFVYNRLNFDQSERAIQRESGLFATARVDDAVEVVYGALSRTVFSPDSDTALARLYPDLADVPSAIRMSTEDGRGKNFIRPEEVRLVGRFTVGLDSSGQPIQGQTPTAILSDAFNPGTPSLVNRTGGKIDAPGGFAAGYVLQFQPGAREKDSGQVSLKAGQARLVVENTATDSVLEVFPYSVITRRNPSEDADAGVAWGRYVVDDGPLASVPGENSPVMAPEFWVPAGYRPVALYVKNVRLDAGLDNATRFPSSSARQSAITTGSIVSGGRIEIERPEEVQSFVATLETPRDHGLFMLAQLPGSITFQDGTVDGLNTNDMKQITDGEFVGPARLAQTRGIPRELVIREYQTTLGASLVQILLTGTRQVSDENLAVRLSQAPLLDASRDEPIYLVDANGTTYPCIGYVYVDNARIAVRYTRDDPIAGLSVLPSLPSRSRTGQEIYLTFEVTTGAEIVGFVVGDQLMVDFETRIYAGSRSFERD